MGPAESHSFCPAVSGVAVLSIQPQNAAFQPQTSFPTGRALRPAAARHNPRPFLCAMLELVAARQSPQQRFLKAWQGIRDKYVQKWGFF